jgi:hypothetical protein
MTRYRLAPVLLAGALLFPAAAAAKGPSEASVSGPGLGKALELSGGGEQMGTPLGNLTMEAGLFPASFGQSPDPMLKARPSGELGPKYTIHYVVPGPNGTTYRIDQDLYPYAKVGAVTYTKPGQPIFDSKTLGGWYLGGLPLKLTLVHQGLPAKAPDSGTNMALLAGIAVPGGIGLAAAAAFITGRRRNPRPE